MKALMGDTSDNIPGVPSIGEKTATKIITEYHSIENAYEHVEEVKPPRASKALKEHWDLAVMSKTLATIHVDADFAYSLEEARLGNIYTEEAYAYFQRLQFKNLLNRFDVTAPSNAVEDGFTEIRERKEADRIFAKAGKALAVGVCVLRIRKMSCPFLRDRQALDGIGICFGRENVFCIYAENDITMDYLVERVKEVSESVQVFSMF